MCGSVLAPHLEQQQKAARAGIEDEACMKGEAEAAVASKGLCSNLLSKLSAHIEIIGGNETLWPA